MKKVKIVLLLLLASCNQGPSDLKEEPLISQTEPAQLPEVSPTSEEEVETVYGPHITWSSIGLGGGGWLTSLAFAPPSFTLV